ncbi:pyridoxamine 5'-phosphate oxidase family protein [Picosynechococcus sp. NKBG042902]|uniref:pyridoxamine 5'-phosphate oxidase family protein n=1 Tax=Picosynechococcus sp. NKBG042902 TaxID=490193 RepID=UPI0004AA2B20|nr:pyridoxamine 5'-phosphate oxidase family protein [Picosynechococcus sp. NKBG042902]
MAQFATAENSWIDTTKATDPEAIALVKDLLETQIYCNLSTCSPLGWPWSSPLLFVWDQGLNLYWSSAIAAQHSQNLYQNQGRAMVTVYDASRIKAAFFAGTATELTALEPLRQVLSQFDQRAKRPTPRQAADYLGASPRRMYQFTAQQVWVSGDRLLSQGQLIDTKVQLDLDGLKDYFSP